MYQADKDIVEQMRKELGVNPDSKFGSRSGL